MCDRMLGGSPPTPTPPALTLRPRLDGASHTPACQRAMAAPMTCGGGRKGGRAQGEGLSGRGTTRTEAGGEGREGQGGGRARGERWWAWMHACVDAPRLFCRAPFTALAVYAATWLLLFPAGHSTHAARPIQVPGRGIRTLAAAARLPEPSTLHTACNPSSDPWHPHPPWPAARWR